MDPTKNPYSPGAGLRPPVIAGRDDEIKEFEILLDRLSNGHHSKSPIFSGLRGVGKTVLLRELEEIALKRAWFTTGVREVPPDSDFRGTLGRRVTRLLQSMSLKHQLADDARRALDIVAAFIAATKGKSAGGGGANLPSGIADSGDLNEDLTELFDEIGKAAKNAGTGALIVLDELQNLDEAALGAICQAMQFVGSESLPVAFIGAGLPDLPSRLAAARPYSNRLFTYPKLEELDEAAAERALREPANDRGVEFEDNAIRRIAELSGGYPYFVQEYGRVLWNEIDSSPVTKDDVEAVHKIVQDTLAVEFFDQQFALATDAEQRYLLAMAELGVPCKAADVGPEMKRSGPAGGSRERDSLIKKELIWVPKRGLVEFTLPQFDDYLLNYRSSR